MTFIPQILLGGHDDATSSSIDLSQTLAAESGLGVEHDNIPPPPSEHVRRRSELRQKPAHKGEDLELTVLPSVPEDCHASAARPKSCDTEIAPRSLNASQVSSVRVGDDFNSTTPVVSANQNAFILLLYVTFSSLKAGTMVRLGLFFLLSNGTTMYVRFHLQTLMV